MKRVKGAILALVLLAALYISAVPAGAAGAVVFADPALEARVRREINRPDGELTIDDVKNVENLNLGNEDEGAEKITDLSGLEAFENLFSLSAFNNDIEDLSPLSGLKCLQYIDLGGNRISDLSPLRDLQLGGAGLWGNKISDLSSLTGMGDLEWLSLDENRISDLSPLKGLTKLNGLSLAVNEVSDLSPLASLKNLQYLSLGGNPVGDLGPLKGLDLIELNMWDTPVSDLSPLAEAVNLEKLDLVNNRITDVSPLAGMAKLRVLHLDGNGIADFSPIAELYDGIADKDFELDTRTLMLRRGENPDEAIVFTDPVLEARIRQEIGVPEEDVTLGTAAEITGLNLGMPEGTPDEGKIQSIRDLLYFSNLEYVNLYNNNVTDISPLLEMPSLRELWIAGNPIETPSLLGGMTQLERLGFTSDFTEGVPYITNLTHLVELNTGGVRALPDDLYKLGNLEILCVPGGELADISVLAQMPKLTMLDLSWNLIADISALEGKPLTELYIAGNPIGDYEPIRDIVQNLLGTDIKPDELFAVMDEPENPGEAIVFSDALFESCVREALGKPEGDITAADAATLTELWHDNNWDASDEAKIRDITGIRYFINLRKLGLSFNGISDIGELAGLTYLMELSIGGNGAAEIGALAGLTKMQALSIFGNGVEDIGALANMTDLYYLNADSNPIGDISPLAGLTQMDMLDLSGCGIEDISAVTGMTNLRALDLADNNISNLWPLSAMQNLQRLYLARNPITDLSPIAHIVPYLSEKDFEEGMSLLPDNAYETITFPDPVLEQKLRAALNKPEGDITAADAASITNLSIANDWQQQMPEEIMVTNLEGLQYFINLRELDATFNRIADASPLAGLTNLKRLSLAGNALTDVTPLAGLTNMEDIQLWSNMVRDIRPLSGMVRLGSLRLSSNPVKDLSPLSGLTGLGSLFLGGCGIEDINALAGLVNLDCLELDNNYIADLSALAGMRKLVILKLANNPIADYAPVEALYPQLQEKDFDLGQVFDVQVPLKPDDPDAVVEIGDAALEALLRESTGVYDRALTQQDLCAIGRLTREGNSPEKLIYDISALRYCLNMEGFAFYGAAISDLAPLSGLTKLRVLAISNAMVSDLTPLADLMTLTSLELSNNHIVDVSPLAGLTWLQRLDLSGNEISDFSPLTGLQNLDMLKINQNPAQDVSVLKQLAGELEEKDFDPNQPLEAKPEWDGGNSGGDRSDWLQPENPDAVVEFNDPVFESRVREQMGIPEGKITAQDAAGSDRLNFNMESQENIPEDTRIHDLKGIEYFINLKELSLNFHAVSDIAMLTALKRLETLELGANGYSDLSGLASLPNLRRLLLFGNGITDISALAGLTQLNYLQIEHNQITDISALAGMPELKTLDVQDNRIADFSPLYGLKNLETLRVNYNATRSASGLKDIAGNLQEKDFDPDQPLEPGSGGFTDRLQPKNPDKVIAFADRVFEKRIREALNVPEGDITAGMAAQVDSLELGNEWQETFPKGSQFSNISGIQYFINLRSLNIAWNKVEDIGRLSKLTGLEYLHAYGNRIIDVTPLAGLTNLVNLNLGGNKINKIGTLAKLTNLKELYLDGNPIKNYSPLKDIYPQLEYADFKLE